MARKLTYFSMAIAQRGMALRVKQTGSCPIRCDWASVWPQAPNMSIEALIIASRASLRDCDIHLSTAAKKVTFEMNDSRNSTLENFMRFFIVINCTHRHAKCIFLKTPNFTWMYYTQISAGFPKIFFLNFYIRQKNVHTHLGQQANYSELISTIVHVGQTVSDWQAHCVHPNTSLTY